MDTSATRLHTCREACTAQAHFQWLLYALPQDHPAQISLLLAAARADRQRQGADDASRTGERDAPALRGATSEGNYGHTADPHRR